MIRFVFLLVLVFDFIFAQSSNFGLYYCNNSQTVKVTKDSLSTGKTTYEFKKNINSKLYDNDIFMYKTLTAILTNTKNSKVSNKYKYRLFITDSRKFTSIENSRSYFAYCEKLQ